FVVSAAAVGGGLALGLDLPFGGPQVIRAQDGLPEVNAWVVIRPDDTVVIRIARSEMGQGSLTGLAQLVGEALECNWSKGTTEGGEAQGPEGLEDCRQAAQAARHHGQAHRQAALRDRCKAPRYAERGGEGMPGLRRQG